MNSKAVLAVIIAMSLTLGDFAFADEGNDRQNERGGNEQAQHSQDRERGYQDRERGDEGRRDRRDNQPREYEDGRRERGAGPNHAFYRGERLPQEYRHRNYVVDDWRDHHLSAPPRGYHWVQTGSDYVLIAIATGIIAQILLSH